MSFEKIKEFVREHKDELIITAEVVGGIVLIFLGQKHRMKKRAANGSLRAKYIPIPKGLKVWNTSYLWKEGGYLNAIIENIPMDDLGELGEQFIKNGFAQPGDIASVIIGVERNQ